MKVIGMLNKKGGAGKTHTAVGLAAALRAQGHRVGLIDTDPNGSASRWLEASAVVDGVPCSAADLEALLGSVSDSYDVVVIDSPPNDVGAIETIAHSCDLVVVPIAPTPVEIDQLADTVALLGDARWVVVPVRVRMATTAGRTIREMCADASIPVSEAMVPLAEGIAQSFGEQVPTLPYVALATEIFNMVDSERTPA